jgi:diketogulonate reductase-like aldo/keto reductase
MAEGNGTGFIAANGVRIPKVILGTYAIESDQVANVIELAIKNGYRALDTAEVYDNEGQIGDGLKRVLGTVIHREELTIITKVWSTHY